MDTLRHFTCALQDKNKEDLKMPRLLHKFAATIATASGSPWAFMLAFLVRVDWAISGPTFHFSVA
jgi:low affinity Fe/Cu permease